MVAVAVEMIQMSEGRRKRTGSYSWNFDQRERNSTAPSSNTREKSMTCKRYYATLYHQLGILSPKVYCTLFVHILLHPTKCIHKLAYMHWSQTFISDLYSTNIVFFILLHLLQQLADESQVRIELQMALDSKDSDIEQLRSLLNSLNVHSLDSVSMSSGPDMDTDESLAGKELFLSQMCIFGKVLRTNISIFFIFFITTFSLFTFFLFFCIIPYHHLLSLLSFGQILNATLDLSPFTSLLSLNTQVTCMEFSA